MGKKGKKNNFLLYLKYGDDIFVGTSTGKGFSGFE
jgi:hypothetical protein